MQSVSIFFMSVHCVHLCLLLYLRVSGLFFISSSHDWAVFVCFTQFGGRLSQCQNFDNFRNTAPLFKLNLGNKKTVMPEFVSSNLSLSIDSLVLLVISPETRVMSLEIFSQVAENLSFSVASRNIVIEQDILLIWRACFISSRLKEQDIIYVTHSSRLFRLNIASLLKERDLIT